MTHDELMAIPEIPFEMKAFWREPDDPVNIWDTTGRAWTVVRIKGNRFRMRTTRYDDFQEAAINTDAA